jgi:hypothetical protein
MIFAIVLLSASASAQTIALSRTSPVPMPSPGAVPFALTAPAALVLAPSAALLAPGLLAPPAPSLIPSVPPAAASADRPAPGTPRAADALAKGGAEFARLVADLMSGDADKSAAAAVSLMRLKEDHLNSKPDPKKTRILDLKPMQIPVGMIEVQDKARALRDMKHKEADAWLLEHSVPVLEDYKGRERPVDHHHEARAAWEADIDEAYSHRYFDDALHAKIKALDRGQFYAVTGAMGLFYDRDQFGAGPHDPNHLPEDVRGMADDPYRSLAGAVRKRGGYDKSPLPFAEFRWARYFRENIKTYPTRADFDKAVAEALAIAHDPAAKDLPGYKPR